MTCSCKRVVKDPVTDEWALCSGRVYSALPKGARFCPCCGTKIQEDAVKDDIEEKDWPIERYEFDVVASALWIAAGLLTNGDSAATKTVLRKCLETAGGSPVQVKSWIAMAENAIMMGVPALPIVLTRREARNMARALLQEDAGVSEDTYATMQPILAHLPDVSCMVNATDGCFYLKK